MRQLRINVPCLATLLVGLGACSNDKAPVRVSHEPDAASPVVKIAPSDDDDATVQGILIDAEAGDTVFFQAGEYNFTNQLSLATSGVTFRRSPRIFTAASRLAGATAQRAPSMKPAR